MADRTRLYTRQPDGRISYFSAAPHELSSGELSPGADASDLEAAGYVEASPQDFSNQHAGYSERLHGERATSQSLSRGNLGLPDPVAEPSSADEGPEPTRPVLLKNGTIAQVPSRNWAAWLASSDAAPITTVQGTPTPVTTVEGTPTPITTMPPMGGGNNAPPDSGPDARSLALARMASGPPASDSPEDVDALAAAFDADMASRPPMRTGTGATRRPGVSVQQVPPSVALASPLGGSSLPSPSGGLSRAMAQQAGAAPTSAEETLADVQTRAARERALAGFARAGSRMGAAIAGVKPESGPADDLEQGADQQVRDYLQRKQAADFDKQQAEQDALKDPSSPQSKRFQVAVSKALPGVYSPDEIALMSASDEKSVLDLGKMRATLDERAQQAKDERASREQIAAENRQARSEDARQRSLDRQLSRDLAAQQHKDMLAAREGMKEEDFNRKMTERNVGGYTFDPKNPPTADGAKQMAHITTARDEVLAGLDNLEQKINENGSEMFGATAGDMESDWMNITNRLRNLNQMGVPNGKDYEMLAKQLVDPTSMASMMTSKSRMLQQIKTLRRQMGQTVDATAKAYKFTPAGGGADSSGASVSTTPRRKRDAQGRVWEEQPDGSARMVL